MSMEDLQRKLIEEALAKKRTAKRADLLVKYPQAITLTPDYYGYFNPRVTAMVDATSLSEVTHLKFTPVPLGGFVVIEAGKNGEDDAEPFNRGDSGRTGSVALRAALTEFNLTFPEDRKLKLPAATKVVTVDGQEQTVVMFLVKRPVRKKKELRPRKNGTAKTGTAQAGASAAGAASAQAPAWQPETETPKPATGAAEGTAGPEKQA